MEYNSTSGPRTTATSAAEGRLKPMVGGMGRMGKGLGLGIKKNVGKKMGILKDKIGKIKMPDTLPLGKTGSFSGVSMPRQTPGTFKMPEMPSMPKMPDAAGMVNKAYEKAKEKFKSTL